MAHSGSLLSAIAVAACMALGSGSSQAQSQKEFYSGKSLRLLVGYGPGTGYDVYARTVARHLADHIPGAPTLIVENMPGAGGLTMANHLYNVAPKDGTAIGLVVNVFLEPLLRNELARFDPKKFSWIGSVSRSTPLCFTWHTTGIKSLEDAKGREVLVGAIGRNTDSYYFPQLINSILGTRFKPVLGYPDSGAIGVAMESGELDGFCSFTLASVKSARPEWLDKKRINILVQLGAKKSPELPDVPLMLDLARTVEDKQALAIIAANWEAARPFAGPPDVPQDRLELLRTAFMETMHDKKFLDDAQRTRLEVDPLDGPAVEGIIERLYKTPSAVVERMIKIRDED